MSSKGSSSPAKPSPSKKKETIQTAHTTASTSASSANKGQSRLKSLKAAKNEKDAEIMLKQIRQQIEGNEKLKKSYLDGGIVKEIADLIDRYEGIYLIEYFSICLLCDLIYDFDGKERMMKESIHIIVLKIMKENKKDQHLQYEACRLLKRLMIKTSFAQDLSSIGVVGLVKDIIKIHKTEMKVMIEACKCLRLLMSITSSNAEMKKFMIDTLIYVMKNNKQDWEMQYDCINDIKFVIQGLDDDNDYAFKSNLAQTVFQSLRGISRKDIVESGIELIQFAFKDINNNDVKYQIAIARTIVDIIRDVNDNEPLTELCVKILFQISNDTKTRMDLLSISADRAVCVAMKAKYPQLAQLSQGTAYIFEDRPKISSGVVGFGLQFLHSFSSDPELLSILVTHDIHAGLYHIAKYITIGGFMGHIQRSREAQQNFLHLFVEWLESPDRDKVLDEALRLKYFFAFNERADSSDLSQLRAAFHLLTTSNVEERILISHTRILHDPRRYEWCYSLEELKNVARVIDYEESCFYFIRWNYHSNMLISRHVIATSPSRCAIAIWLLCKFMRTNNIFEDHEHEIVLEFARNAMQLYPDYQSTFILVQQPMRYYCQEIIARCRTVEHEDRDATFSSSISMIKSAAFMKKE